MKRFLLLIASVLFLWHYVDAQTEQGTIRVKVPVYLDFQIVEPSLKFAYNEADPNGEPPTYERTNSTVTVKTNVAWKFMVYTKDGAEYLFNTTNPSEKIPANVFNYYVLPTSGITSGSEYRQLGPNCPNPITGIKSPTMNFDLQWRVAPTFKNNPLTTNQYAGIYITNIVYVLSAQ